ncbi:hypothetical protein PHYSODRAFT_507788 [Phytophthora sojae]|uniref:Uncharacterized protein n=1 Tax=Phytophthora sojae (strain P6497) TaxID=1094619 RepID=G4ZKT6_PHYSP|nr:hypothetical protein PHYSODRAFT_507788 [Phytophthora sojae]EGZ14532.1 hypothetical protein PHYSODRAFT_507788 [Phytophthora sojae]|eukprot:XP_009528281.1 hypothetical protein PHYSODRAFT_507788 [Phytophthora sojae]
MEGSASAAVPCTSSATTGNARSVEDNVGDSADEDEQLDSICQQLDFGDDDEVEINVGVDRGALELVEATVAKYVSVGFYDSLQGATVALQQHNEFEYTYKTRYTSKNVTGTEFKCRSHAMCPSPLKIVERKLGANLVRYELLQKGEHGDASVSRTRHGIAAVHKSEIDSLLELGMGASRVRNMLLHKYRRDPDLLNLVPEVRKIENRKATIKKNMEEGWDIDDFNTIDIWAHSRLCQTREVFDSADESDFAKMNELLVLERFQHNFDDNGKTKASLGLIMTSRALFRNVAKATTSQRGSLAMSTDGTYRIPLWQLDVGGLR